MQLPSSTLLINTKTFIWYISLFLKLLEKQERQKSKLICNIQALWEEIHFRRAMDKYGGLFNYLKYIRRYLVNVLAAYLIKNYSRDMDRRTTYKYIQLSSLAERKIMEFEA